MLHTRWRDPRNWWLRNADGCCSYESAIVYGYFLEAVSVREKVTKIASVGKSKRSFRNSNLDAFGFGRKLRQMRPSLSFGSSSLISLRRQSKRSFRNSN